LRNLGLAALMLVLVMLSFILNYSCQGIYASPRGTYGRLQRLSFTLYDYAYVVLARNKTTAYFEIPTNYSDGTLNQTVYITAYGGNVTLSGKDNNVTARIAVFNGSYGFVVVKIKQSFLNLTDFILRITNNPTALKGVESRIPSGIEKRYVRRPASIVKQKVVPDFVEWLRERGYSVKNVSKVFLAIQAAIFIYLSGYIHYNASALPRTLADVVNRHQGDCDDMSRVLMNLLWYYGIPAKMEYSYVYLPLNITMPVEGSYVRFVNAGPHAYTLIYVPTVGWVSLDFLAGARLNNPSLVEGESLTAEVTEKQLKHIKKELSKFRYAEEVMLFKDNEVPHGLRSLNVSRLTSVLHNMLIPLILKVRANAGLNQVTTSPPVSHNITTTAHEGINTTAEQPNTTGTATVVESTPCASHSTSTVASNATTPRENTTYHPSAHEGVISTTSAETSTRQWRTMLEPDLLGFALLLTLLLATLVLCIIKPRSNP